MKYFLFVLAMLCLPVAAHAQMVNAQTGTTYTFQPSDCDQAGAKLVTFSNAAAVAVTLPQAGLDGRFLGGCTINAQNLGAGLVTITPTTSTINGAANLPLTQNSFAQIRNNSTPVVTGNYFAATSVPGSSENPTSSFIPVPGTDATGNSAFDNSVPINAAAAVSRNGTIRNVYLPAGIYHVKHAINIGSATQSQCLVGDGDGTIIDVDSDFDSAASGVVVIATGNTTTVQPCVVGIQFLFHQPTDVVTTTTAGQTAGNSTIALTSAAGIVNGMVVVDTTATGAILSPTAQSQNSATPTTVTISGLTATLSAVVQAPGVGSGDTVQFAQPRSAWKTLAQGCTTTVGGTGCKYPWAIYNNGAQNMYIDRVLFVEAWDGIYQRGQTFRFGTIEGGAYDIGLDIGGSNNGSQIDTYLFWNFNNGVTKTAVQSVFYDGTTIAANIGVVDALAINNFQTWMGIVNFTADFHWGQIANLALDGNNASLNVLATSTTGFLQIGNLYSTKATIAAHTPIVINSNAAYTTSISNLNIRTSYPANNIVLTQGILDINGGYFYKNFVGTSALLLESAGLLKINNVHMAGLGNATAGEFVKQAAGALAMHGNSLDSTATAGWTAVTSVDNALNSITGNSFNSWAFQAPGPLGDYNPNIGNGLGGWVTYTSTPTAWLAGTLTSAATTATYQKTGQTVCVNLSILVTTAGTATSFKTTLPTTVAAINALQSIYMPGVATNGIGAIFGSMAPSVTNTFIVGTDGLILAPVGGRTYYINGCYQTL